MKMTRLLACAALVAAAAFCAPRASAVDLYQIDTFEDGTTQGWIVGLLGAVHPAPPANVPGGGPAGADDNYMLLTAVGGGGAGSKLSVLNLTHWGGDYLAAGIPGIAIDLNNMGADDLYLRLLISDPTIGPPANAAFSLDPIVLPAGSGWVRALFPVDPLHLGAAAGTVEAALTGATELRLYHGVAPGYPGGPVVASLGVDNIQAVPEPSALCLLSAGVLAAALPALRRRARSAR